MNKSSSSGKKSKRRVLLFGSFDPLHEGHEDLFRQANKIGSHVIVVVDRDETIRRLKQREPHVPEKKRVQAVVSSLHVAEALLGEANPRDYTLLKRLDFDVLALGYDQAPPDDQVRLLLNTFGKTHVDIVRLKPYRPGRYKSSLLRSG